MAQFADRVRHRWALPASGGHRARALSDRIFVSRVKEFGAGCLLTDMDRSLQQHGAPPIYEGPIMRNNISIVFLVSAFLSAVPGPHAEAQIDLPARGRPTATNVFISGTPQVGQVLAGHYTYVDIEGDPEGDTAFRWRRDEGRQRSSVRCHGPELHPGSGGSGKADKRSLSSPSPRAAPRRARGVPVPRWDPSASSTSARRRTTCSFRAPPRWARCSPATIPTRISKRTRRVIPPSAGCVMTRSSPMPRPRATPWWRRIRERGSSSRSSPSPRAAPRRACGLTVPRWDPWPPSLSTTARRRATCYFGHPPGGPGAHRKLYLRRCRERSARRLHLPLAARYHPHWRSHGPELRPGGG